MATTTLVRLSAPVLTAYATMQRCISHNPSSADSALAAIICGNCLDAQRAAIHRAANNLSRMTRGDARQCCIQLARDMATLRFTTVAEIDRAVHAIMRLIRL